MSNARYEYDENAETWPYFVLSTIAVPLIPATASLAYSLVKSTTGTSARSSSSTNSIANWFKPYNAKQLTQYRHSQSASRLLNVKNGFIVIGWAIVASLVNHIKSLEIAVSESNFDPWKLLQISESASEKLIKTAYRKLSLKYHPDKIDTSSMTQEEIDSVDAAYVLINKAYKALTDETVRENFLKFGNPDGPSEIKHGIALPKFLIDGPTSPFLVLFYILLIAVVLPLIVSNWWNGVKSKTKQDVHVNTAHNFMKLLMNASPTELLLVDDVLRHVSASAEYLEIDQSLSKQRVYELLKSYINREVAKNAQEETLRLKIVAITPKLLSAYIDVAAAFKNTDYCLKIVDAHRCLIQALNIEESAKHYQFKQLLQLPATDVNSLDTTKSVLTLGKLLKNPGDKINVSEFLGIKDKNTVDKLLNYAKHIPLIEPVECKFKVPGEDIIPPSSSAHISLKFIIKSAAHKGKPDIKSFSKDVIDTQFTEEETMENLKDPFKVVAEQPLLSTQLASELQPPFFPDSEYATENSGWAAFLIAQRDNKIIEIPHFLHRAEYTSNVDLSQKDYESSLCQISTFKFPLQGPTPKDVGEYHFRLVLRNMAYFGADLDIPLVMKVEDIPVDIAGKSSDVYGIEDPDEDSIAGAMAQLRGDAVKKISFENEYESSDDENDEESEEEIDWTDLDTDTEVEEDALDEK